MNVQMKDGLAAVRIGIYHHTIAVLRKALVTSDLCRCKEEMSEQFAVTAGRLVHGINVPTRYDQQMNRRLRAKVLKSNTLIILENNLRRDPPVGYLTKNAIVGAHMIRLKLEHSASVLLRSRRPSGRYFFGRRGEVARHPLDVGTEAAELSDNCLVAAVDVIYTVDRRLAVGTKGGKNERC